MTRIFILSPAQTGGKRAALLFSERAKFELAQRLRTPQGAPLGEVFSFLSGLYFRGKLTYARRFARPAPGLEGCYVITSDAGLASPDEPVTLERLQRFSQTPIDVNDPRYVRPLEVSVHGILQRLPPQGQVVLLGSIATDKYVSILREHFARGWRFRPTSQVAGT